MSSSWGDLLKRLALFGIMLMIMSIFATTFILIKSSQQAYQNASTATVAIDPFPLGVDPRRATITEQAFVKTFYEENLAAADFANKSWLNKIAANLQTNDSFQQLASPVSRVFVVWPGNRTEEAVKNIGDVMHWNNAERIEFTELLQSNEHSFSQGYVLPGQYISHRQATPEEIATLLKNEYEKTVTARYTTDIEAVVPFDDALIIASLIEREASDFENMREISGVIWNRLFIDMPLQLDATLQYVKAENPYEPNWWPVVRPQDKFIDSPFNTYQNNGLPPEPIANPSVAAIVAALNPRATDCLFYFHSASREYYCSETYEDHVSKLRNIYGQGR